MLRIAGINDFGGLYADTITSMTTPMYPPPFNPNYNFTDSVVYKILTAIDDSTVVMDCSLHGSTYWDQKLIIHIRADNSVWLSIYEDNTNGILRFGMVNADLHPYCLPSANYFYLPYNYYDWDFKVWEHLKKL